MATGRAPKDQADQLNCAICQDIFDNPRILPCGHSFCLSCLDQFFRNGGQSAGDSVDCPTCRKPLDVPRGGASSLAPNFELQHMLEQSHGDGQVGPPTASGGSSRTEPDIQVTVKSGMKRILLKVSPYCEVKKFRQMVSAQTGMPLSNIRLTHGSKCIQYLLVHIVKSTSQKPKKPTNSAFTLAMNTVFDRFAQVTLDKPLIMNIKKEPSDKGYETNESSLSQDGNQTSINVD